MTTSTATPLFPRLNAASTGLSIDFSSSGGATVREAAEALNQFQDDLSHLVAFSVATVLSGLPEDADEDSLDESQTHLMEAADRLSGILLGIDGIALLAASGVMTPQEAGEFVNHDRYGSDRRTALGAVVGLFRMMGQFPPAEVVETVVSEVLNAEAEAEAEADTEG